MVLTSAEQRRWGSDILFVGHWEPKREADIAALIQAGLPVRVIGNYWHWRRGRRWRVIKPYFDPQPVWGADYARALCAGKIILCFYSTWNHDTSSSRTFEIPACGRFMLCERNHENIHFFVEGKEADYFSSPEELIAKARYYLEHADEREQIAQAGLERCRRSGYDYVSRLRWMLEKIRGAGSGH